MKPKPKQQLARKIGYLWQVCYGFTAGSGCYGYGVTRKAATQNAKAAFNKH